MRKLAFLICCTFLLNMGCSPCKKLQQQDAKITQQFENLQAKDLPITNTKYVAKLKALYSKEQLLLETVRNCDLSDPTVYNYWYGERLKFSSDLEKAWYNLQRSRQSRKRVTDLK